MLAILPRRSFVAALFAAVLAGASLTSADRTYSAGRFALFVDGEAIGAPRRIRGGAIRAEVETKLGPDNLVRKSVSAIKYEPITIEIGMGMGKGLYDWIDQSWNHQFEWRSGAIVAADPDYEALGAREFFDALITEVKFPALDASSREPAYMTVKIQPEEIVYRRGGGIKPGSSDDADATQRLWTANAFRFELGSLPCERVSKIDSFSIKQVVRETELRSADQLPSTVEVPNLKITFSAADVGPWYDWFEDFVIRGNCSDADELEGSISFLSSDMKEELGRVDLFNVGIVSLEPDEISAGAESVSRVTVSLYVESMVFAHGGTVLDDDQDDDQKDDGDDT